MAADRARPAGPGLASAAGAPGLGRLVLAARARPARPRPAPQAAAASPVRAAAPGAAGPVTRVAAGTGEADAPPHTMLGPDGNRPETSRQDLPGAPPALCALRGPGILSPGPGDPSSPSRPSACPAAVTAEPQRCSIDVVRATAMLHRCCWLRLDPPRHGPGDPSPRSGRVWQDLRGRAVEIKTMPGRRPAARVQRLPARHAQHRPMLLQQAQAGPRRGHPP
jgi:hypothetical protein